MEKSDEKKILPQSTEPFEKVITRKCQRLTTDQPSNGYHFHEVAWSFVIFPFRFFLLRCSLRKVYVEATVDLFFKIKYNKVTLFKYFIRKYELTEEADIQHLMFK